MHEVSLVTALVEQVQEVSRREHFQRVLKIRVAIGELSGVEPDAVEFCFSTVAQGSVLEGAELFVERRPAILRCDPCATESSISEGQAWRCSQCGSTDVRLTGGKEFQIIDLDVSEENFKDVP